MSMSSGSALHRVVIVGAGFGGLEAVRDLKGAPVSITLVDQRNHHLFQPLLYQAATASLAPSEIAWPIRALLRGRRDVTTIMARAIGVDVAAGKLQVADGSPLAFDTLILATGARHAYFGHREWEAHAPGLKTIEDATRIRSDILLAFEQAEREPDAARRAQLLTFVVIGAGPTGVELAGTIADLARDTLGSDFRAIDPRTARVLLIEAGSCVLAGYAPALSTYTEEALKALGVEVALNHAVTSIGPDGIVYGRHHVAAGTILWAAGVQASPAAMWLRVPADRAGRLQVLPDLTVPEHPQIFAIGDTVSISTADGKPVPGIAPAAKQQGRYVAGVIRARRRGAAPPPPFQYRHHGSLAQIGKGRAVADFGWIKLTGAVAWWLWGIAHIYFLIGARSRLSVALSWLWIYLRDQRAARLIVAPGDAAASFWWQRTAMVAQTDATQRDRALAGSTHDGSARPVPDADDQ